VKTSNLTYTSFHTAKKTNFSVKKKTNWLMLFKAIITVFSENHTKLTNTICGQNAELLIIMKAGGTYGYHWALKG
jgi:hypothetical protein